MKTKVIRELIEMGWIKEHLEYNDDLINDIISIFNLESFKK